MIEVLGIIGTCFILFAFLCNKQKHIRLLDMIGAALFAIYGILTKTWSTFALNVALIGIQLFKLYKIRE